MLKVVWKVYGIVCEDLETALEFHAEQGGRLVSPEATVDDDRNPDFWGIIFAWYGREVDGKWVLWSKAEMIVELLDEIRDYRRQENAWRATGRDDDSARLAVTRARQAAAVLAEIQAVKWPKQ